MSATPFHRILWSLLHFLVGICISLIRLINRVKYQVSNFINSLVNAGTSDDEIHFLEQCKADLTKLPRHLNVTIGTDCIDAAVFSRITIYALISGIDYISFYDVRGDFTLDRVNIPRYVETRKMSNGRFLWSMPNGRRKYIGQLRYKNGLEKSIEVVVLTSEDNKQQVADVCRDLWTRRSTIDTTNQDNLTAEITNGLNKRLGNLPEPELAMIFNRTMCSFGLMPWHTRFTEFHCIKDGNVFDVKTFARVLYKFSKCEQRFGK